MRITFVAVVLSGFALAACETPQDDLATTGSTQTSTQTAPSPGATVRSAPQGVQPGSKEDFVRVGDRVFFDFDRYDLRADARGTLERQAIWLKQYPSVVITIQGHTDERGTREYNLALGERRATAVKNYLVALGVDSRRVKVISYGKEVPFDPRSNEDAWSLNRRGVSVPDPNSLASATN